MATAVRSRRRPVAHRPPWMRQRDTEPGAGLALGMIALLLVSIGIIVLSGQLVQVTIPRVLAHVVEPSPPTRPIDGATPVPVTKLSAAALSVDPATLAAPDPAPSASTLSAPAAPAAAPAPETPASSSKLAVGSRARVANTDGVGVVLYGAPRPGARQPAGLLEGTSVTVLELAESEWARVQADNRQSGWIHAEFLAPAN
jgi:hypothetical protein